MQGMRNDPQENHPSDLVSCKGVPKWFIPNTRARCHSLPIAPARVSVLLWLMSMREFACFEMYIMGAGGEGEGAQS